MPHGSIRSGDATLTALCDVEIDFPRTLEQAFPDVPDVEWGEVDGLHPGMVGHDHAWHFHDHCFLVRGLGPTVLFDTGLGPSWTLGARYFHPEGGALPRELEDAGVQPADVDVVVLSHLHADHIGWNVTEDGALFFPNARVLIQEEEMRRYPETADEEDLEVFDAQVKALERLGAIDVVDGEHAVAPAMTILKTPGHTPGSQSLLVGTGNERAILCGDLANHPHQVEEPRRRASGDQEPERAAETRARMLDRIEAEGLVMSCAHFDQPFGRVLTVEARRRYVPISP